MKKMLFELRLNNIFEISKEWRKVLFFQTCFRQLPFTSSQIFHLVQRTNYCSMNFSKVVAKVEETFRLVSKSSLLE